MKVSAAPVTVLLVGGGSIIVMDELDGVQECISPPNHGSANAVGAAIGKVAGEIDIIEIMVDRDEKTVFQAAEEMATAAAVEKAAEKEDVKIVQFDKIPLHYVANRATRIVIKAVGRLAVQDDSAITPPAIDWEEESMSGYMEVEKESVQKNSKATSTLDKPSMNVEITSYRPEVKNGVRCISSVDIEFIACGTGVLGAGEVDPPTMPLSSRSPSYNPTAPAKCTSYLPAPSPTPISASSPPVTVHVHQASATSE